ncbi:MAG: hypothetical protein ACKVOP_10520 [Sphingomonadaceae bacterium]
MHEQRLATCGRNLFLQADQTILGLADALNRAGRLRRCDHWFSGGSGGCRYGSFSNNR